MQAQLDRIREALKRCREVFSEIEVAVSIKWDARRGKWAVRKDHIDLLLVAITLASVICYVGLQTTWWLAIATPSFKTVAPPVAIAMSVVASASLVAWIGYRHFRRNDYGSQAKLRRKLYRAANALRAARRAFNRSAATEEQQNEYDQVIDEIGRKRTEAPEKVTSAIANHRNHLEFIAARSPHGTDLKDLLEDGQTLTWLIPTAWGLFMIAAAYSGVVGLAALYERYVGETVTLLNGLGSERHRVFYIVCLWVGVLPVWAWTNWKWAAYPTGRFAVDYVQENRKYRRELQKLSFYNEKDAETERAVTEARVRALLADNPDRDREYTRLQTVIIGLFAAVAKEERRAWTQLFFGAGIALITGGLLAFSAWDARADMKLVIDLWNCGQATCTPVATTTLDGAQQKEQWAAWREAADRHFWLFLTGKLTLFVLANTFAVFFTFGFRRHLAHARHFRDEATTLQIRLFALKAAEGLVKPDKPETLASLIAIHQGLASMDRNGHGAGSPSKLTDDLRTIADEAKTALLSLRDAANALRPAT